MIDYEHYILLKNKGSYSLQQLNKKDKKSVIKFNKKSIDLETLVGKSYGTYKLAPRTVESKTLFAMEPCDIKISLKDELLKDVSSGENNQEIWDDGTSQQLKKEDIDKLQEQGLSGTEIISQLAENNKSFKARTEFSQEKYVTKKEKKYSEYIEIVKPSIRILSKMFNDSNPQKSFIRPDSLALLVATTNLVSGGNYVVLDETNQGLIAAAVLDRLQGKGTLWNFQNKGQLQKLAISAMNFSTEQLKPLKQLNSGLLKSLLSDNRESSGEAPSKKPKLEAEDVSQPSLQLHSLDGMIIASKRPLQATLTLMKLLSPSKGFAIICPFIEPLTETYAQLREQPLAVNLKLTENWMRSYQVLPSRTHPEVNMSGSSGYVLSGITVSSD